MQQAVRDLSPSRLFCWLAKRAPSPVCDILAANYSGLAALLPCSLAPHHPSQAPTRNEPVRVSEPVHPTSANIPALLPLVYAIDLDNMTQKRHLDCGEDQPLKRARRVFAQFPLNLFRIGPSITFRDNTATNSTTMARQESCVSCSSLIDSRNAKCTFCERQACSECELVCFKCDQVYCGLCAMRTYAPIYNSGKCFSCD